MRTKLSKIFANMSVPVQKKCMNLLGVAHVGRAEEIYGCYKSIKISEINIMDKLNPDSTAYFGSCGGIFTIPDIADIKRVLAAGDDVFIISENMDAGKAINALLHVSVMESNFYGDLNFSPEFTEEKRNSLMIAAKDNRIVYPLEYVSVEDLSGKGIVYPLLGEVYGRLAEEGYVYALVEIYTILGYEDVRGTYVELNCQNKRSIGINSRIGGIYAGSLGIRQYYFSGVEVTVRPDIYVIRLREAVSIIGLKADKTGEGSYEYGS